MKLEQVRKELIREAKEEASQIIKEAEQEKDNILAQIDDKVASYSYDRESVMEKRISDYTTQKEREAESILKREKLAAKKELLDKAFDTAMQKLDAMSHSDRAKHIKKLMKADFKHALVYVSEKDKAHVKKSQKADIAGGVILENKEGDVRVDLSYSTLLENVRGNDLGKIEKKLFK